MHDIVVTARQGLAIGGPAEVGYDKTTLPYVPGSALRGALATVWIRDHGPPTAGNPHRAEFIELFERSIRYGPLLQEGTAVVPLSAVACKYPRTPECVAWSIDAAIDADEHVCPHCGHGVETGKGQITGLRTRRVLRTELDQTGRPLAEHLFARHELQRGLTYQGQLSDHHPWLATDRTVWLGGKTSTNGRATVRVAGTVTAPAVPASRRADGALVIRFTSPALIVDDAGRPTLDPVTEILRVLKLPPAAAGESRAWIRADLVSGWHAASGLPKPAEIAIAMGSVIVLWLTEQPNQDALSRLVTDGIGLRRVEGFGMLELNPPPWRKQPPKPPAAPVPGPSLLARVRGLGLLDEETTLRWLLDRTRLVAIELERDPGYSLAAIFAERVALHLDDDQASAVRDLFTSGELAAAIPLLEQALDALVIARADRGDQN
jgi:CRISPR-associated protein Csx10